MSLFLVVPRGGPGGERAAQLARIVGAVELSKSRVMEVLAMFRGEAGGPPFSLGTWSFLEVAEAHPDRLSELSRFMKERVEAEGVALVDLDERLFSVSEVQQAATGLGLSFELVAIVKDPGRQPLALTRDYQDLLEAITALGGRNVSMGQIVQHVGEPPEKVRPRLRLLMQWGRIVRTGRQGGARYSLAGEEER